MSVGVVRADHAIICEPFANFVALLSGSVVFAVSCDMMAFRTDDYGGFTTIALFTVSIAVIVFSLLRIIFRQFCKRACVDIGLAYLELTLTIAATAFGIGVMTLSTEYDTNKFASIMCHLRSMATCEEEALVRHYPVDVRAEAVSSLTKFRRLVV